MTQVNLPNRNITGDNLWSQVEDNDDAIVDVVNGGIDNGNIATAADINGAKLLDGSIKTAKLDTDAVTNPKIATGAVSTDEIASAAVTAPKLSLTITSDAENDETTVTSANANVSGLSVSLVAGTYLIVAPVNVFIYQNVEVGLLFLYNQSDSTAISLKHTIQSDVSTVAKYRTATLVAVVTLSSVKTIGVRLEKGGSGSLSHTVPANSASITAVRIG